MNLATIRRAQNGDQKSINEIIKIYSPAIKYMGRKFSVNFYDVDDLEQVARIGIWKSILKFQEDRLMDNSSEKQVNKLFSVCVKHHIKCEIFNVMKKQGRIKRRGKQIELKEFYENDRLKTLFDMNPEIYNHIEYEDGLNMRLDLEKVILKRFKRTLYCVMKTANISEAARMYQMKDIKFRTKIEHIKNIILKADIINC